MKDITSIGEDLTVQEAAVPKAANLFQVQIAALEYAKEFGIDMRFFIDPELQFQNESFKAYLIQRLAENNINVAQVLESLNAFTLDYVFTVGADEENNGGFIK